MNALDKKLLMCAASAAGIKLYEHREQFYLHYVDDRDACGPWNPLTVDGDALRLAVKLGLFSEPKFTLFGLIPASVEEDAYAATRRAIVCAAAAMMSKS